MRSTTLTFVRSSRLRSWLGASSPSQMIVSAPVACDRVAQLVDLAASDVGGRVGLLSALDERVEHLRAGRLGEQLELGERVLGVLGGALGPDADEDDPLEPQLAVLDLGDVLELGREAGDAAQGLAFVELEVVGGRSCDPFQVAAGDDLGGAGEDEVIVVVPGDVQRAAGDVDSVGDRSLGAVGQRGGRPAAQAPVPQERVSPEPRSCTRIAMCRSPSRTTNSMLTPSG